MRKIESVYQSRFLYRHGRQVISRILVGHLYTQQSVVVVVDMITRVGLNKLYIAVRLRSVGINTCPTVLTTFHEFGMVRGQGHLPSVHIHTPTRDVYSLVGCTVLRTGIDLRPDLQCHIVCCDMPHLLAGPNGAVCVRAHLDVCKAHGSGHLQEITCRLECHVEVIHRRSRIRYHPSECTGRRLEGTRQTEDRQFTYLGKMGFGSTRTHRLSGVVFVFVVITYIVIRAVRIRHTHQIRLVILRAALAGHTRQTIHRIDLLDCSTIGRFLRVVFVHTIPFIILLVGCKEIAAATVNRVIQQIETEERTRGLVVLTIRIGISCFTFGDFTCT